jgi:predicted RNA-binding Zn-ribbon protein involved in translation (DUF1610 family)
MRKLDKNERKAMQEALLSNVEIVDKGSMSSSLACPNCGEEISRQETDDAFVYSCKDSGIVSWICNVCRQPLVIEREIHDRVITKG